MLKLLKLMFLADKESLIETGFPITGDSIVAMEMGPVPSGTYDRLKPSGALPFVASEPGNVTLQAPPPKHGRLSDYEIEVAQRVYKKFGHMTGQQLINYLHKHAPEWTPPAAGSSHAIDPADMLRAAGRPESEIKAIEVQASYFRNVERRYAL